MASYRVFEHPHALPEKRLAGENVRFVRDGFSFPAVVFPFIWLLWQRLWIALAAFVLLAAVFILLADKISPLLVVFLNGLVGLYLGFEGTNLKATTLKNAGWQETNIVIASDEEEAELRYFSKKEEKARPQENLAIAEAIKPKAARRTQPRKSKNRQVIGALSPPHSGSRS